VKIHRFLRKRAWRPPLSIRAKFAGVLLAALAPGGSLAADVPPLSGKDPALRAPQSGDFVFSILPKAFQKHPTLDMTFNTEVTPYGRLLRPASLENPVYYVANDVGFRALGAPVGGEKPPPASDMERVLINALAKNGFLAAGPGHPPTLAVIYFWGSHNKPDPETARQFPELARKYVLERAILVGGKNLADGMSFAMQWGDSPADHMGKAEFLRDQAAEELYYVVASAYDYQSLAHKKRELAWRTTLTVTSAGLAMKESLPPLVARAAPFFGREMTEPELGTRKISREGHVEIGTATIVADPPAPPPTATKKPDNK